MEATAQDILLHEEQLDRTPSPRRQSPRKSEEKGFKYMKPYTQPNASPIRVRYEDNKKSDIWPESKAFLIDEYHQVRQGDFEGKYVKDLAAYYGVHKDYFKGRIRQLRKTKTLKCLKFKCGRKGKWTPDMEKSARDANKKYHRRAGSRTIAAHIGVSKSTVNRQFKKHKWIHRPVRVLPKLKEHNFRERDEWTSVCLSGPRRNRHMMWTDTADYDEKIFKLPGYSGKVRYHPDSEPGSDDEDLNKTCNSKRFIPGIMIGAAVTRPVWDKSKGTWDEKRNGKVGIWRCWKAHERGKNRYEYVVDEETGKKHRSGYIYKKGDEFMQDINVDGEFHHELMTMKASDSDKSIDGILESVRQYYGKKKRVTNPALQQDQAGGHAVYGEWSDKILAGAQSGKPAVDFHNQAARTPGGNLCDLGLWPMITGPVALKQPKTTDELWECIQEAFWAIDPDKLDNLAHAKTVHLIDIHKKHGHATKQPSHTEYRKIKNKLKRKPTWTECAKNASKKSRWVYVYCDTCREGPCVCKRKHK